ncbi:hypothetical protein LOC68_15215 [Blastopirellula sp. JC732]|uniref:Uncharacterized protein n=1 Tax=Blastopirellula sediminis TaxID=2894196 RepID=A0A9X1MN67_9BACT|nr:hypothetical protein [Blastopirellula sediminis]MCC9606966.1 hypothetical protein [Blastopirellula sediminis]MCC9629739.1 hypothetical protein [Blastopirellula sediminis]
MTLGKYCVAMMLAAVLLMSGCQTKSGPSTYPVSGLVTYQGKPVESGRIIFVPDTTELGSGPTCACEIVAGKFSGESTAGVKKIEIYGSWETDQMIKMDDGTGHVKKRASIPSKHNEGSKLKVDVEPARNDDLVFELE